MRYATLTVLCLTAGANGTISQSTVTPPGGFVQAGAFRTPGGVTFAGDDMQAAGTPEDFSEYLFAGNRGAGASAEYHGAITDNSVTATSALGLFRATASNSTFSTEPFPSAQANGGWKELFTVNNAALTGQQGFLTFQVRARGTESASGISGSALLSLAAYKNNARLSTNPYFSAGNSDIVATSDQYGRWGIATFGNPNFDSRVVDGVVTFSVPITFGEPFTLGIYAFASAGLRSSGGFGTPCTGQLNFSNVGQGIMWNGITGILDSAGSATTGSMIVSGSGIDWIDPYTPPACGTADFNGDGDTGTDADIEAFFQCLAGDCCPTCYSGGADFDGDGDVGTDADIESFFRVLAGGPC